MRWLCVLLFFSGLTVQLLGESFQALIACDTYSELRPSTKKDIEHMRTVLREISVSTNLRLSMRFLYGDTLSADAVHSWVKSMEKSSPDVILFYYSGHGYRTDCCRSPWPYLFFPKSIESFPSDSLYTRLQAIGSRLVIIILDCCNNSLTPKFPVIGSLAKAKGRTTTHLPGLKTLFLKNRGVIIAAGSSPGEAAFALPNGSLFTNSWLQALRSSATAEDVSWKTIFDSTSVLCSPMQRPIASMEVETAEKSCKKPSRHRHKAKEIHPGIVNRESTDVATIMRIAS